MLRTLPNLTFPVTRKTIAPLLDGVMNLNFLDAGLTENDQRALSIMLHTHDIWVKTNGRVDWRGRAGHERLKQDTETFICGYPITTRNGDLAASHLMIDFHDTQIRILGTGGTPLPNTVNGLLDLCPDLCQLSPDDEKRIGLLMDYCGKKPAI
jgi:hypothetical protein